LNGQEPCIEKSSISTSGVQGLQALKEDLYSTSGVQGLQALKEDLYSTSGVQGLQALKEDLYRVQWNLCVLKTLVFVPVYLFHS
jgi:hypothetical protein